jgi:phytoene synthase
MAELLLAFPKHVSHSGLSVLPADVQALFVVEPRDLAEGRASEPLRAALASMRAHAAGVYARALPLIAATKPSLAASWLIAALVPLILRTLERSENNPFRLVDVPQWRRQWALWRAARRGRPEAL